MTTMILMIFIILIAMLAGSLFSLTSQDSESTRETELAMELNRLLPQTQCASCGYPGCLPYANAIVSGRAGINQCHPGGEMTIRSMAELLGRDPVKLNPAFGREKPPEVAIIDEQSCIGCVKCISACPVDAIIGAARQMHTVMPKVCTGCKLCIAPCPVNCITMVPAETKIKKFVWEKPLQLYA